MRDQWLFEKRGTRRERRENKARKIRQLYEQRALHIDEIENMTGYKRRYISKVINDYPAWRFKQTEKRRAKKLSKLRQGTMVNLSGEIVKFVRYTATYAYFNLDAGQGKQSSMKKDKFIEEARF
jgi:hypothetical protein